MIMIVLFHAVLNPGRLPLAIILIITGSLLLWAYIDGFKPLLTSRKQS